MWHMMTRRRTSIAVVAGLFALSAVGAAVADEHEETPVEDETATDVVTDWNDDDHVLVVTIDDEEACEDVTYERDEEDDSLVVMVGGEEVSDENPLPDGCFVFDGEGKDGKVNHGTIVSGVAKNLSPHDLDIPKGHVMREIAKIKKGEDGFTQLKGEKDDDDEGEEAEADLLSNVKSGKSNGKGKGHSK
jgi:hypothetical protein